LHEAVDASRGSTIAVAICTVWQAIDVALSPVLGSRGVAALYRRSLHVTGAAHPWLARLNECAGGELDLAALESVFAQQSVVDATAGGNALLQTFYQLLASLIGAPLTERMLRSVWSDSFRLPPEHDTTT